MGLWCFLQPFSPFFPFFIPFFITLVNLPSSTLLHPHLSTPYMHMHAQTHKYIHTYTHIHAHGYKQLLHYTKVLISRFYSSPLTQTHAANERWASAKQREGQGDQLSESSVDEDMEQEEKEEDKMKVNGNQEVRHEALFGPLKGIVAPTMLYYFCSYL